MLSPFFALHGQQILPIYLQKVIQLNRLGEIVASSGDLSNNIGIRSGHDVLDRRHDDEGIAELGEGEEAICPAIVYADDHGPWVT